MSSINLLPENFIKKKKETLAESQNSLPVLLSFLIVSVVIFAIAFLYIENVSRTERIDFIKKETERVDKELENAVKGNELLALENKAKNANIMLSDQAYYSEIFNYLQGKLNESVYAKSISAEAVGESVAVNLALIAKDYLSISDQLHIFKNDSSVEQADLKGMGENNDGSINFNLNITVKGSVIRKNSQEAENAKKAD